jgi:hypothetical protein
VKHAKRLWLLSIAVCAAVVLPYAPAYAQQIEGQVLGAGAPIANATVTLFAATSDAPIQLFQTQSGPDGHFTLPSTRVPGGDTVAKEWQSTATATHGSRTRLGLG